MKPKQSLNPNLLKCKLETRKLLNMVLKELRMFFISLMTISQWLTVRMICFELPLRLANKLESRILLLCVLLSTICTLLIVL